MFARERSQIICIFCHNLLALLLQMFAEFYLGISSIRNARNNLVAGETVLALLWLAVQSGVCMSAKLPKLAVICETVPAIGARKGKAVVNLPLATAAVEMPIWASCLPMPMRLAWAT